MIVQLLQKTKSALSGFARNDRGDVNVEGMIFFPFLIFTMAATMVFYDAFRKDSLGDKATFTVGDMLSRETDYITPTYVDSSKSLFNFLSGTDADENTLRVTVVQYDEETATYSVVWSQVRGPHADVLTNSDMTNAANELPNMVDAEQVIVVDTYIDYDWPLNFGFNDEILTSRVFTRPRFAPQLVWSGS